MKSEPPPAGVHAAAELLLAEQLAQKADAARWQEYCRMICERDNEGQEAFGNLIPDGELTKDRLDIAMDAWLLQKGE
jgi:hypothetical protein